MTTLYWHDYETSGIDPRFDRPIQFAGIRTDSELNIIGEPLMIYCQLAQDVLPHPHAALVTGITPQLTQQEGLCEAEFIKRIHDELALPGTCGVGYNSLRFDDEFTRFTLFRNFYDAYAREWQNGNSRWDIIDMVRLTRALRPEGIEWPDHESGKPSFRLEHLTAANGIAHQGAHDALVDVRATIALAKLIRDRQPRLYDFVFSHRQKQAVAPLVNLNSDTPVIHVSRMYASEYCNTALVLPLANEPGNQNGIIVYDLRYDPQLLLDQDADTLRQWLFTATAELPEHASRPALKTLHINKCPVVVPLNTLTDEAAERLQIDLAQQQAHAQFLRQNIAAIRSKIQQIFSKPSYNDVLDPDASLYSGGFISDSDKNLMNKVREAGPAQLADLQLPFNDARLPELLFRYRARNWPEAMSSEEQQHWQQYCYQALSQPVAGKLGFDAFFQALAESRQADLTEQQQSVLTALDSYGKALQQRLSV
ncbi:exodeoxyribonuclease I [Methylophaga lonarensis]|uniref:exodeoxyribonuclease I n=1 Tax=Methylophaga lonarensis TaxID=999151 RepID=UPI003D27D071